MVENLEQMPKLIVSHATILNSYEAQGVEVGEYFREKPFAENPNMVRLKALVLWGKINDGVQLFPTITTDYLEKNEIRITIEPIIWFKPATWDRDTQSGNKYSHYLYGTITNHVQWYNEAQNPFAQSNFHIVRYVQSSKNPRNNEDIDPKLDNSLMNTPGTSRLSTFNI
ncbi:MAG: hypothetical protein FWH05_07425 [Oscillospiraceae bacterium]|nr:hypothetical protein [Oscillospiraceae bacterium]